MITIPAEIIELLHHAIQAPQDIQVFIPTYDQSSDIAERLILGGAKVTGITADISRHKYYLDEVGKRKLLLTESRDPQLFAPQDKFHVAVGVLPFNIDWEFSDNRAIQPQKIRDTAMQFRCSQGKPNRVVDAHLLLLEQMLNAIHAGGYLAAILPKKWLGKEMKYLRWWEDRCATIARIKLPAGALQDVTLVPRESKADWIVPMQRDDRDHDVKEFQLVKHGIRDDFENYRCPRKPTLEYDRVCKPVPGDWEFRLFFKPLVLAHEKEIPDSFLYQAKLEWATQRWQMIQHRLKDLEPRSIARAVETIRASEWESVTAKSWRAMIEAHKGNSVIGTKNWQANGLPDVSETYFFEPTEHTIRDVTVVKDLDALKAIPNAVHVIQTRSKTKLRGYNRVTIGGVADIEARMGYVFDERANRLRSRLDVEVLSRDLNTVKEELVQIVTDAGMTPCMTEQDARRMRKRQRWLDIQLTPLPRYLPVKEEDDSGAETTAWENIYEDVDLKAVFPEVYAIWAQRAEKLNLAKFEYGFQVKDTIHQAAKQSLVNGNLMGLGKTRENLFAAILRGSKKVLIVAPAKLIGTWQDEVDATIRQFCRQQRRHWNGSTMIASSINVIEQAADCRPDRLRQFNIISYDKLKSTPRDGRFYKCPKCGMVVYSVNDVEQQCPGDPKDHHPDPERDKSCVGPIRRYNAACKARDDDGKLLYRKYKVLSSDMTTKVHWNENHPSRHTADGQIKDEDCTIIDNRTKIQTGGLHGGKPTPVMMVRQDTMFAKYVKVPDETVTDPKTGKKTRTWKSEKRKSHVKWTFSELLRHRFNLIIPDEILYAKNADSLRAQALNHMTALTRWSNTGTPLSGMPQDMLNYFNWTVDRHAFPDYRLTESGGQRRFLAKYMTTVRVGCEIINGMPVGGTQKQIPKINNPELFQVEMSPFILRHLRNEPQVLAAIPKIPQVMDDLIIPMDDQHRAYYQKWLDKFCEWWQKMKEEEEDKKVGMGQIITKLTYLLGASTNPHYMLENIMNPKKDKNGKPKDGGDADFRKWALTIGPYTGPPTAKMKKTFELIVAARQKNEKVIVFTARRRTLDIGAATCARVGINALIVHGGVSNEIDPVTQRSPRHMLVSRFRQDLGITALWAGLGSLSEGFNIPEANHGIIYDCGWVPDKPQQGIGRMLRPQQKRTVYSTYMMHEGTIDEYMAAICYLKGRSHREGIDYMEFDDLSADIIPDVQQYADSIVDGTSGVLKRKMWLAVEHLKKQWDDHEDEFPMDDIEDADDGNGGGGGSKQKKVGMGMIDDGNDAEGEIQDIEGGQK